MLKFLKMHGLSNDFVILDLRDGSPLPPKETIAALADRNTGIGCDQFIALCPAEGADCFMRIFNPDASEAGACGNATRCVASLLMREKNADRVVIRTVAGFLECRAENAERTLITVDMGAPKFGWDEIPLARDCDTLFLPVTLPPSVLLSQDTSPLDRGEEKSAGHPLPPVKGGGREGGNAIAGCAVNMGNPHCVFFIDDAENYPVREIGPKIEHDPLFPEKTNVEFAQVMDRGRIRMRVWERGAGETQACGSGACATVAAAVRRGLADRKCEVILNGGSLHFHWREDDGHLLMTGPVAYVFEGGLHSDFTN